MKKLLLFLLLLTTLFSCRNDSNEDEIPIEEVTPAFIVGVEDSEVANYYYVGVQARFSSDTIRYLIDLNRDRTYDIEYLVRFLDSTEYILSAKGLGETSISYTTREVDFIPHNRYNSRTRLLNEGDDIFLLDDLQFISGRHHFSAYVDSNVAVPTHTNFFNFRDFKLYLPFRLGTKRGYLTFEANNDTWSRFLDMRFYRAAIEK